MAKRYTTTYGRCGQIVEKQKDVKKKTATAQCPNQKGDFPMTEKDKYKNHVCSKEICPICEDIKSKPKGGYAFFGTIFADTNKPAEQKPTKEAKKENDEITDFILNNEAKPVSPAEATENEKVETLMAIRAHTKKGGMVLTYEEAGHILHNYVKKEVMRAIEARKPASPDGLSVEAAISDNDDKWMEASQARLGGEEKRQRQAVENAMEELRRAINEQMEDEPEQKKTLQMVLTYLDARWPNAKKVKL